MKKNCRTFFLTALFLFSFLQHNFCRQLSPKDSILYYLSNVHSNTDSASAKAAFTLMYKTDAAAVLDSQIAYAFWKMAEVFFSKEDFYKESSYWYEHLLRFNKDTSNDFCIWMGKTFAAKYDSKSSVSTRYSFLYILRNMRIPYRNSSHIYEGIEYFGGLTSNYLATKDSDALAITNNVIASLYARLGLLDKAVYYQKKAIDYLHETQPGSINYYAGGLFGMSGKVNRYAVMSSWYIGDEKPKEAENYLEEAIGRYYILDSPLLFTDAPFLFLEMALCKTYLNSDSAMYYLDKTLATYRLYEVDTQTYAYYYQAKGIYFLQKNMDDSALLYLKKTEACIDSFHMLITNNFGDLIPYYYEAQILLRQHKPGEAIAMLINEMAKLRSLNLRKRVLNELILIAQAYNESGNSIAAYQSIGEAFALNKQIASEEDKARNVSYDIEKKMQDNESKMNLLAAQNENAKKLNYYLYGIVSLLILLAIIFCIFYLNKKKSNKQLAVKNEELAATLNTLKSTQAQLIQSEKMASLGELTAGIAHEIQNPLNFVNNFSEVSNELIDEMEIEFKNGNNDEAWKIAAELKQNLEKINTHGKRADAIVKSMLQHSNSGSGHKEFTDINALCDEYLRLAYHGLRAKEKAFNARCNTYFDSSIGKINIMAQDIGRVILNMLNNAFYAVNQKQKSAPENYVPAVTVTTKKINDKISISIKDNGDGIPEAIKQKIFQPFFTTKPTGSGTGLGLSLSYDTVKAHNGEIKVTSNKVDGTEFVILLPA